MFCDWMPSALRKPTQNWCVFQMLSTLGMPTRSVERSLGGGATEGFFANHVGNVRIGIFGLLDPGLDGFHFVDVFDQAFGAGVVADDAPPAGLERDFAPLAAGWERVIVNNSCPK